MDPTSQVTVTIGEEEHTIRAFSPRKVLIAGQMLRSITKTASDIARQISEFRTEYRERNAEIVTRQMAALPPWNTILEFMDADAWERAGGQVELRRDPSDQEIVVEVFPVAFDLAEDEVTRLLALTIIPNQELGTAALECNVEAALDEYGRKILDEGDLGQLIDLADTTVTVLREELTRKADPLKRLRALFPGQQTPSPEATSPAQPAEPLATRSGSSIDSPAPTDGDTERSSTESPGAPLSGSAV